MDVDALVDQLSANGSLLLDALDRAPWDARVPGLDWDLRELAVHTGGVHRWATAIVRGEPADAVGAAYSRVGSGPTSDELLAWLRTGIVDLVGALQAAPNDLDAFTFLPARSPRHFWARRQAHETAIHRADAEAASGAVIPFPTRFAQDGIAEMLLGFGARRRSAVARPGTLLLRPTDDGAPWRLVFGGETTVAEPALGDGADVVVNASSSDLYLWLWNRPAAQVEIGGDATLAALWRERVRVTWS
jgi:uncharacterized protein (TIGR03083 family)